MVVSPGSVARSYRTMSFPGRCCRVAEGPPEVGVEGEHRLHGGQHPVANPCRGIDHDGGQGLSVQPAELGPQALGLDARELEDGGCEVHGRAQCIGAGAAGDVGVDDDQGDVEVLVVDEVALLVQPVAAGHIPVVGGEHDDRVVGLSGGSQRVQDECHAAVDVADAVEVEVSGPGATAPPR